MFVVLFVYCGYGVVMILVKMVIDFMKSCNVDEVVFEIEEINIFVMRLYEWLGFLRFKKFYCYYLNGNSVYRLVFLLRLIDLDLVVDLVLDDVDIY